MALEPAIEALDKLAKAAKVPALSSFVSVSPTEVADLLDMDEEELGLPPEQWFAPANGLATIRATLAAAQAPTISLNNAAAIAADLKSIGQELEQAEKRNVPFHFVVLD
jgi:hypothetical protein